MARLLPFKGVLYNQDVVGDVRQVVAPPYDVIDREEQRALHARHPENVIRLELGLEEAGDGDTDNRYTRAAAYLKDWLARGALRRDDAPAVYPYSVEYLTPEGAGAGLERKTLVGFLGLMELQEFGPGRVLPHENTRSAAKTDRLNLLTATRANFSPIFSLFPDADQRTRRLLEQGMNSQKPRLEFTDEDKFLHRLWAVTDPRLLASLAAELAEKPLFIADGHHRYETALNYQRLRRQREASVAKDGPKPYDGVLMLCAALEDPGLTVLPTHRVLTAPLPPPAEIRAALEAEFRVEKIAGSDHAARRRFLEALRERGRQDQAFGLALAGEAGYLLLTLRREARASLGSSPRDRLDVSVLHGTILARLCPEELTERNVIYTKSDDEALDLVGSGSARAAFLLNPTKVSEVSAVATAGERMPHKSTYFFPKPLTGLVMHVMDEPGS